MAVTLLVTGLLLWPREPEEVSIGSTAARAELASLEDAFARAPYDHAVALRLADSYLELNRPGLVIATLAATNPRMMDDPRVAHRVARAYEQTGRVADALATSDLALARFGRPIGT